jgi:hypothetical protein
MKTNFLPQLQMDFSGGLGEDSSSFPVKPKTFEELFAGTGIEPTKDENGGVHYNFNATLKNEPMKLYTENQLQEAYNRGIMDGRLNNVDYSIPDGFKPIESQEDPDDYTEFINYIRRETGMSRGQVMFALEQCKEEIGNIVSNWLRAHGKKTSSDDRPNSQRGDVNIG